MFRKGQNYRIFIEGAVVAEETSCTVTKGVDTEDASNKDLAADSSSGEIGGQTPVAVYKNMTFQVEAEGEGAKALFSSALALMSSEGGAVGWAPTNGTNNRSGSPTYVQAICNDLTINAPNRQPVTCSAQFTVISDTASAGSDTPGEVTTTILRGEFLRLFLTGSPGYIAAATNCSLHLSLSLEDATTKDVTSSSSSANLGYKAQEPTTISYDITSECLYDGGGLANLTVGTTYGWELADASGAHQQTEGSVLASGSAMLTSLVTNATVNQNITYSATFTGVGVLEDQSPQQQGDD